ncbi:META domain-containing protein [Pasteurellaceae bacterium 20609_3]|uniref:META domain-containing protein n=1 Tax=Spirabiliibacterium mucosae TaxID=28156 RepID=UPI001AAE095D|nr:META domain-containing protein [Spirabiliibacterium mucosae]MBE2898206.1 META domain-containing protein [Spirabiliibacterium mucosae]
MPKLTALLSASLLLAACSTAMTTHTPDSLLVRHWQVIELDGKPAEGDYALTIARDGKLSAYFGCNRIIAALERAQDGQFKLASDVASTRMLCPHGDEQRGIAALQSAVRYDVVTRKAPVERLELRDGSGKVRLTALYRLFN